MILDEKTFSISEWDAMSVEQWATFVLDPTGGIRYVVARAQVHQAGVEQGECFRVGAEQGQCFPVGIEIGKVAE